MAATRAGRRWHVVNWAAGSRKIELESDTGLQPSERRADAKVRELTEGDMPIHIRTEYIELFRAVEF